MTKEYRMMFSRNRRAIMGEARQASENPFDWEPGIRMLVSHLRFVKEYYELGENVDSIEYTEWDENDVGYEPPIRKTRLEMVTEILNEYDLWMTAEDRYYGTDGDSNEPRFERNEEGMFVMDIGGWKYRMRHEDPKRNLEERLREKEQHRKEFFRLLSEYIEHLWD